MQDIDIPTLEEVTGDLRIFGISLRTIHLNALQRVAGGVYIGSERLVEFMTDELTEVGGDFTLCGTLSDKSAASSPCNQLFLPKLARAGGTVTLSHFDGLSGLATSFGTLYSVGGVCYEHLAKANTFEFPQLENSGAIRLDDCPLLRSIVLPKLAAAASLSIEECPAVMETNLAALERIDGNVCLRTLPGIEDFGLLFPCLASVGGDLTLDDLPSLSGTVDFSQYTFASGSTVSLRFVSEPKIEEIRGGEFGGSLTLDASPVANQPEKAFRDYRIPRGRDAAHRRFYGCRDTLAAGCPLRKPLYRKLRFPIIVRPFAAEPFGCAGHSSTTQLRKIRSREPRFIPCIGAYRTATIPIRPRFRILGI